MRRFSTSLGRDLLVAPRAGSGEGPDPVRDQVTAHVIAGGGNLGGVAVQLVRLAVVTGWPDQTKATLPWAWAVVWPEGL